MNITKAMIREGLPALPHKASYHLQLLIDGTWGIIIKRPMLFWFKSDIIVHPLGTKRPDFQDIVNGARQAQARHSSMRNGGDSVELAK